MYHIFPFFFLIFHYSNSTLAIRVTTSDHPDGAIHRTYTCAIANGRYFGGGMHVAPDANFSDGLFDVIHFDDISHGQVLCSLSHQIRSGTHIDMNRNVTAERSKVVHVAPVGEGCTTRIEADGEVLAGGLPATFTVCEGAVEMIMPDKMIEAARS